MAGNINLKEGFKSSAF